MTDKPETTLRTSDEALADYSKLPARLEAMLRSMALSNGRYSVALDHFFNEAREIVAMLPPPIDRRLAQQIVAEEFPDAREENQWALWRVAEAGIKAGRELERQGK